MHHKLSQKGDLGNSTFSILCLVINSGCESAGFLIVAALGLQKFLWLPKNVRTIKYSYLEALFIKQAIDVW